MTINPRRRPLQVPAPGVRLFSSWLRLPAAVFRQAVCQRGRAQKGENLAVEQLAARFLAEAIRLFPALAPQGFQFPRQRAVLRPQRGEQLLPPGELLGRPGKALRRNIAKGGAAVLPAPGEALRHADHITFFVEMIL